jgi:hypothetical protein
VTTRDIRTSGAYTTCDVCGRTLLRGERAETYLAGGERREVCELCKSRALHEGWVREGTVPAYDAAGANSDRRRSFFSRFRNRGDSRGVTASKPTLADDLDGQAWSGADAQSDADDGFPTPEPPPARRRRAVREPRRPRESGSAREPRSTREPRPVREPRHVRAVPTGTEQKQASAVDLFNSSEHRRTIAGVARSLGIPTVSVLPSNAHPSVVNLVVSWELCWYRYEVDLSDDEPTVRVGSQGYELDELAAEEQQANAVSDETGTIALL